MFAIWGSFSQPTVVDWFMAELQGFFRAYFFKSFLGSSLRIGMKGMSLNSLTCDPRHFLLRSGFFGDFDQHSRSLLLARAYDHFRSFCRTNRIACSQPPFKEHMVSWQNHMWCWFSEWFFETYDRRVRVKQDVCSDLCPTKLYKKNGDTYLTAKAYNGRCILAWLSETVCEAISHEEYSSKDDRCFVMAGALTPDRKQ